MAELLETLQVLIAKLAHAGPGGLWAFVPAGLLPPVIFLLRATDQTLATLRTLLVSWGRRRAVWALGLLQSLFFLAAVAGVFEQLSNPFNLVAYAAGYGAGSALGITIEGWLAPGHAILRVVSSGRGAELVGAMRAAGRGVTELPAHGRHGTVSVLLCSVPRRRLRQAQAQLQAIDPTAFVSVEKVHILGGGWIH